MSALPRAGEPVDQVGGDLLDARLERLDPPRREGASDEATDPVVQWRVDLDDVRHLGVPAREDLRHLGRTLGRGRGERSHRGERPVVLEDREDVVVAGHYPESQLGGVEDRLLPPGVREHRERILPLPGARGVERDRRRLGHDVAPGTAAPATAARADAIAPSTSGQMLDRGIDRLEVPGGDLGHTAVVACGPGARGVCLRVRERHAVVAQSVDQHLRHAEGESGAGVRHEVRLGHLVLRPAEELLDCTLSELRPGGLAEVADAAESHARVDHSLGAEPQREVPACGVADGDDRTGAFQETPRRGDVVEHGPVGARPEAAVLDVRARPPRLGERDGERGRVPARVSGPPEAPVEDERERLHAGRRAPPELDHLILVLAVRYELGGAVTPASPLLEPVEERGQLLRLHARATARAFRACTRRS